MYSNIFSAVGSNDFYEMYKLEVNYITSDGLE